MNFPGSGGRSTLVCAVIGGLEFILSLFSIIIMFAWGQPRRKNFAARLVLCGIVVIGSCVPFDVISYFCVPPTHTIWMQISKFGCGAILSCVALAVCFKVGIWEVLYFGVVGYCIQHLTTRVFDIFRDTCLGGLHWAWSNAVSLVYYCVCYALFRRFYIRKYYGETTVVIHGKVQLALSVCVVGISIVYNTLGITYATGAILSISGLGGDPRVGYEMLIFVYVTTSLIALLAFALSVTANGKAYYSRESHMLDKLLSDRRARYEQDKLNVELLNMRLHDLKHYIGSLDEKTFKEQKDGILAHISQYDIGFDSGNDALDALLTNKSLQCKNKDIRFNAMLGGASFGKMPKFELYTVFCNAIDNAIEAVESLPVEKRFISITARFVDGKTTVTVENYFDGSLRMQDNMPLSDKKDGLHGVGVKSMKILMEKYGGRVGIEVNDDIFSLELEFA